MISSFNKTANHAMIDALGASPNFGASGVLYVYPFMNDVVPSQGMDSTSFVFADSTTFTNGGNETIGGMGSFVNGDNEAAEWTKLSPQPFSDNVPIGATLPATVYGYVLSNDSVAPNCYYMERFDTPIELTAEGQVVQFPIKLSLAREPGGSGNIA